MKRGCLYAITNEASPSKLALMIGSICGNLEEGTSCVLVVDSVADIESDQAKALWGESLTPRIDDGSLNIFIPQDDFKKNIFRYGIKRFLRELELFSIPSGGYLWIQQAEELLMTQDMPFAVKQAELLKEWLAAREITAVLVFSRLSKAELSDIHLLQEALDGFCAVGSGSTGVEAKFAYWRSPEGLVDHESYGLASQRSGFYLATRLNTLTAPEHRVEDNSVDEFPKYFCLDLSLKGELDKTPWPWKYPESYLDLYHATRDSKSPTIVFEFSATTDFIKLAETIHIIRRTVGRSAKIIVHENGYSLRHASESMLMLIGTNLIIHRDIPSWRIAKTIESLEGVRFERKIDEDIDSLFANVTATFKSGFLPIAEFIKETVALVFHADCIAAPKALIKGVIRPGLAANDIVQRVSLSREGDLISTTGNTVYIFLYACPDSQAIVTIERKISEPIEGIFLSHQLVFDSSKILEIVDCIRDVPAQAAAIATVAAVVSDTGEQRPGLDDDARLPVIIETPEIQTQVPDAAEVEAAPKAEPAPEAEPTPAGELVPESEPAAQTEPELQAELAAAAEPTPEIEPAAQTEPAPEPESAEEFVSNMEAECRPDGGIDPEGDPAAVHDAEPEQDPETEPAMNATTPDPLGPLFEAQSDVPAPVETPTQVETPAFTEAPAQAAPETTAPDPAISGQISPAPSPPTETVATTALANEAMEDGEGSRPAEIRSILKRLAQGNPADESDISKSGQRN